MTLVFDVGGPDVAEVVAQERVDCTVAFPDGSQRSPCSGEGSLIEVRRAEEGRTYAVAYQAPGAEGTYEVDFQASSTARLMPHDRSASTSFRVLDAEDPAPTGDPGGGDVDDPTEDPDDTTEAPPQADGGEGERDPDAGEGPIEARLDEARLVATMTVASAGIAGGLLSARTER